MDLLKKKTKAELAKLLRSLDININSKTSKTILIEKIEEHVEENPDDIDIINKFLKGDDDNELPESSSSSDDDDIVEIEEQVEIQKEEEQPEDDDDEEEEEEVEEGDEEEEQEEEEEEEGEDDEEKEEQDDDDEEEDKDYEAPPPLNLKEWVLDPIIAKSEDAIETFYNFTDCFGITYLRESEKLRDQLSSTVTLNYLQILLEFLIFIFNFTKIVPLNENKLIHQIFFDNLPYLSNSTLPTLEITQLFNGKSLITLFIWIISSVLIPGLLSYFINFTSRVIEIEDDEYLFRIHSFDPFIFALSKILTFYFIGQANSIGFLQCDCLISGLFNKSLINLGLYQNYATNSLGNLPYVIGAVNVLISIYAQFEEY